MSWGLSSAVGASPDDDFHLASIWCGHGLDGMCGSASLSSERTVYSDLVNNSICFAFKPNTSASCQGARFGDNSGAVVATKRVNLGGYPPVYYFAMSWFATPDIDSSVLVIRLINSALFVAVVSALFALLPLSRRPTLLWALLLTMIPLGVFIVPSINPSSWAVISAGTLWLAFLGFLETHGRRRLGLGVLAAVTTLMGAGARGDSAFFCALSIALVLLLKFEKTRRFRIDAIFGLALIAVSAIFYLSSNQKDAISTGLAPGAPATGLLDHVTLALADIVNVPSLWVGVFGSWPLGWLDTTMPGAVWVGSFTAFCGAVFLGLRMRVARKGAILAILLVVLWAVPTILLVQSQSIVGANFQPRYLLPVIVLFAGFLLLRDSGQPILATRLQRSIIVITLSLANSLALFTNIRRYVTGLDVASVNLDSHIEWWWHLAISPLAVWILGSLAFAAVAAAINSASLSGQEFARTRAEPISRTA